MNAPISSSECNCFALRQAARHVTQIYERHLSKVGLTPAQYTILVKLQRRPGWTMLELAEAMVMERTTLVRALKPLQRELLLVTEPSGHDARTLLLSLSASGMQRFREACTAWRAAQAEFEKEFGHERSKALRSELFSMTAA